MTNHIAKLQQLRNGIQRKQHLEKVLADLNNQRPALYDKVEGLKQKMQAEQKDVEKLEQSGLSAFFYELLGKKEEKLSKEKQEAYEARIKYSSAAQELASVDDSIRRSESELQTLHTVHEEYEALLPIILTELIDSGSPYSEQILNLQQQIAESNSKLNEIEEAQQAGNNALSSTEIILEHLSNAESWSTFDILGGNLIADFAKHSALDKAQIGIQNLQERLRTFKTELTDVTVDAEIQVTVDGFLGFADFFFDGLFADWAVMDEITNATGRVKGVKKDILSVIQELTLMKDEIHQELAEYRKQLENIAAGNNEVL